MRVLVLNGPAGRQRRHMPESCRGRSEITIPLPQDWTAGDSEARSIPTATYHLRPATAQEFARFDVDAVAYQ